MECVCYSHSLKAGDFLNHEPPHSVLSEIRSLLCKLKQEYVPKHRLSMLVILEELIEYGKNLNLLISGSFKNHT
jgi:hypothetical protein